jgi:glucokinase
MTKKYAMGIDIGGTNTAFGLVDEDGNVVAESKISTDKYRYYDDYKPYVEALATAIKELIASQPECDLIGIGVGAPNANIHTGVIETPANLWKFENPNDPRPNTLRIFKFVEDLGKFFAGVRL